MRWIVSGGLWQLALSALCSLLLVSPASAFISPAFSASPALQAVRREGSVFAGIESTGRQRFSLAGPRAGRPGVLFGERGVLALAAQTDRAEAVAGGTSATRGSAEGANVERGSRSQRERTATMTRERSVVKSAEPGECLAGILGCDSVSGAGPLSRPRVRRSALTARGAPHSDGRVRVCARRGAVRRPRRRGIL